MALSLSAAWRALFTGDAPATKSAHGLLPGVLTGAQPPRRGTKELLKAYKRLPWLHTLLRRIAEDTAAVPWEVYAPTSRAGARTLRSLKAMPTISRTRATLLRKAMDGKDVRAVDAHPFLDVLERMNPVLGGFDSWVVHQVYTDVVGQAPLVRTNNALGQALELWPVPPHWIAELPRPGMPFYRASWNAWQRLIPEGELVWGRVPDMENPYERGSSYGEAMGDELDVGELRARYLKGFFANDARPAAIVTIKGASPEQVLLVKERMEAEHRGPGKTNRLHVTTGELQYQQIANTLQEMQTAELSGQDRDFAMQVLQFPLELLGMREGTNRATIGTAEYLYARGVLLPRKERQRSLMQPLLSEYDENLLLGYASPVPDDADFQAKHMVSVPSAFTLNEHRRVAGQEPLPGPEGDELFTPAATPSPFGGLGLSVGRPDPVWTRATTAPPTHPEFKACRHADIDWDCSTNPVVCCECRRSLGCHFAPQPLVCRGCRGSRKVVLRSTQAALEALRPELLTSEVGRVQEEGFERWAQAALDELGVGGRFDMRNPLVRQRLEQAAGERIRLINATTLDALREQLAAAAANGEGIDAVKWRVEQVFEDAKGYRAECIARTELVGLSNAANVEAWRQSGVVDGKEWLSVRDGNTRDSHRGLDGQTVDSVDGLFRTDAGRTTQRPGGFGIAEEDINCRCTALPRVNVPKAAMSEEQKALAWKAFDTRLSAWEADLMKALQRGFEAQKAAVLAAL
jgi:SPP1 gp7 family putative phage head morphogenesis protein